MTDNVMDAETERQLNEYQDFVSNFIDGFTTKMFHDGIIAEVDMKQLQKYFANPDDNNGVLSDLAEYFFISSGEIHMMFELIESLPSLNYKINSHEKSEDHSKYISEINKTMRKIKHKPLTRDVLKQTALTGTLTGMWLGKKKNIYPYIFDDPTKVFPAYRKNGDWILFFDLNILDEYKEFYQNVIFENLSPYVTKKIYNNYKNGRDEHSRHVELPQDRTFVVHTQKLRRNQGLGTGWANSAMFDVLHKRKMKNVEQAIANKIINAIAILTIGNEKEPEKFGNKNLSPALKKKVFGGVRKALEAASSDGIPVVALPEFAKLAFPDVKTDGLNGNKFDHVNSDINTSLGMSGAITHGEGGNNASGKINLSIFYKRIGVLLEQLDSDMYQKMINLILPKTQSDNYFITYDKSEPLTTKEKVDVLLKLNSMGWSVKHLVDELEGVDWEQFLEQTMYETEELELQSRLLPYQSSYTTSSNEGAGAGEKSEEDLTPEGEATRTGDKNNL
ncbi:hypothetical protein [Oceanobacillus kimchii]|uniref:Portal protein n=1 Tax=Oceanobacillus kimchii TaxID=746691 RepID=A0ABQ5TGZ9_9BACI|nr:hypothetical protein [Oceanobacillus kimchii]GLO66143.1 hypothetical protein MACH08_19270 [Oceanobacillus kimchii]